MSKLWIIVILMACALGGFIILNRGHAKIQEALIIAFTAMLSVVLGVLLFGTEKIEKNISTVTFLSLEQKKPVFFTAPILVHYCMQQGIMWGEFERNHAGEAKKLVGDLPTGDGNLNMLQDFQAIALMNYLKRSFVFHWDMVHTKKVLPGVLSTVGSSQNADPKDKKTITSEQLVQIFKQNKFCDSLRKVHQITVPKGTEIKYIPSSEENRTTQILISKKFAFEIKITFSQSCYYAGLGTVGNYTGLTEPTNVWGVNWENQDKFATAVVDVKCEAEFFALKSGNPKVLRYKKWIENLFDNLHEEFDWSVCNENMQKYNEELAHQRIVSGLGKGFEQNK